MKIGIYKIQSIRNFKVYIGSAINIQYRWKRHLSDLRKNKHHCITLQRHYNKYGESDLLFEVIEYCKEEELIKKEQSYLDFFTKKFNICDVAGSCIGIKKSEEFKKKISILTKGANNPTYGLIRTKEWRNKISEANKGKPSKLKGKKANFSEQHKKKLSELAKNRIFSEETRKKISNKAKIPINQFDKNNSFIKEWDSIKSASLELKIDSGSIVANLKGRLKTAGGYIWKYKM